MTDSSPLSSSVVTWGRWTPNVGQGQYWVGTLELTYSPLINECSGKRGKPKTYTHDSCPLLLGLWWRLLWGCVELGLIPSLRELT